MPYIDPIHYQHPLDTQALISLKSIPGFDAVTKVYVKEIGERQFFIKNNSTNIRLSPHQMPEVYNLLPPICERLGIPVPHLYLSGDRDLNAYTFGEHDPFIVVHAGAVECCTPEVLQAIIAHECGHIVSHHVLYHTMGNLVMSGVLEMLPGLAGLASMALKAAFLEWMRASEYTADRVAALALGSPDPVVDFCMCAAGAYNGLGLTMNGQAFLEQAAAYEQAMITSSTDKVFEIFMYALEQDHPLNAYRALEVIRWGSGREFADMNAFLTETVGPIRGPMASQRACMNCGAPYNDGDAFCMNCGGQVPR